MDTALQTTNSGPVETIPPEHDGTFGDAPIMLTPEVRAEVDIQISTARRYPRSLASFKRQALEMVTFDEETAAGCFYSLPRGGKPIEGPSVRLAEIVLSAWGNCRADGRVVGADDKSITAEALFWDLEKNVAIRVQVKRRITDRNGRRYNDDMITVTGNAAVSIALRNAVFKGIPMIYTKSLYRAARSTAIGDVKTLEARRAEMLEYFGKMGVPNERIFAAIGRSAVEDIGLDELAMLKGAATAIKDGDASVDDIFPPITADDSGPAGIAGMKGRLEKAKASKEPADFVDPAIHDKPDDEEPSSLEITRALVMAQLEEFPKSRQKDLVAGKKLFKDMTEDELKEFSAFLTDEKQ